jgi:hypothetical protein
VVAAQVPHLLERVDRLRVLFGLPQQDAVLVDRVARARASVSE